MVATADGWVTGVRLLGTSPEALDDYLDSEILGDETPDLRRFLLDTAVLDVLEPDVCAAVTGRDDATSLLAATRARLGPLVLVADDRGHRPVLRHHDLLRAALRRRLAVEDPTRVPALHRAAAGAVTDPAGRVEHLLAAGAGAEAADAVAALAGADFPRPAELHHLETSIRRLPPAEVTARPRLGVLAGFAAVQRGRLAEATALLEPALEGAAAGTARADRVRATRRWPWSTCTTAPCSSRRSWCRCPSTVPSPSPPPAVTPRPSRWPGTWWRSRAGGGCPGLLALAGDEARPLLEEVGGPTVTTALAALDGPAGPAPVPVPGGGEVLSGREVEVLRLLADGASNRTVAERLVVSENTVKTHVRHLLTKLGAGSRGEAVALARRHHLL